MDGMTLTKKSFNGMYNSGFVDFKCFKKNRGASKYWCEFEFQHKNYKSAEIFIGISRKYKHKNDVGYFNSKTIYMWCFDGRMRIDNIWY